MFKKTLKSNKGPMDDPSPMTDEQIAENVERLTKIAKGELAGYFVVIETNITPGVGVEIKGSSKTTNSNLKAILGSVFQALKIPEDTVLQWLLGNMVKSHVGADHCDCGKDHTKE